MDQWEAQRTELHAVSVEMYRRGLVGAYSGNASLRLEGGGAEGLLLITPSQKPWYRLGTQDLVVMNLDGEPLGDGPAPSSETALHLEIHRNRRDVAAVVHSHSIYASATAVAGREIPPIVDEMIFAIGGGVPIGDYAFPGTEELAQTACQTMGEGNAVLLRNHGVRWGGLRHLASPGSMRLGGTSCAYLRPQPKLRTRWGQPFAAGYNRNREASV